MKRTLRALAATTGIVTVLTGTLVAGTAAADAASDSGIRIIAQHHTENGGWVEYTLDGDASGMTIQTVEEVGGGIWSYGATANAAGQKSCYSQYSHATVAHGSSVSMDGSEDSDWVGPGGLASSRVTKYTTATCKTYWRK